jgi:hypothetical protein
MPSTYYISFPYRLAHDFYHEIFMFHTDWPLISPNNTYLFHTRLANKTTTMSFSTCKGNPVSMPTGQDGFHYTAVVINLSNLPSNYKVPVSIDRMRLSISLTARSSKTMSFLISSDSLVRGSIILSENLAIPPNGPIVLSAGTRV